MRLLNTTSLEFKEFFEDQIPPYAILSHTWGPSDEEVSFQEMSLDAEILEAFRTNGYSKIVNTCRLALMNEIEYVWVDTCCIDKSSSAELTEAINSMFRWYEKAKMCYVYLADVTPQMGLEEGLKSCRWITRGWTLQELIAPRECHLFDSKWTYRGRKTGLKDMLAKLTRVPAPVLANEKLPRDYSVAQRFSWAAKRTTTRREDVAYCLLGLFGIHMPMIYGEGEMAFHRMQEEIIRRMDDPTIFAWDPKEGASDIISILAPSPAPFEGFRKLMNSVGFNPPEFTLTNKGVKIVNARVHITQLRTNEIPQYLLVLNGGATGEKEAAKLYLRKVDGNLFCRMNKPIKLSSQLLECDMQVASITELYVADFCTFPITRSVILDSRRFAVQIMVPNGFKITSMAPQRLWDWSDSCFLGGAWGAFLAQRVKIHGVLLGKKVSLMVLCDRRADNGRGTPVLSVFETHRFKKHHDYLQENRTSHTGDDLTWLRIKNLFPSLLGHTESTGIAHGSVLFKISMSVEKKMVSIREGETEMYQARLNINKESGG